MIAPDRALFAAAQAGEPAALERLLRELQPDIRRYARRQCHRSSAIEDVVQEALIVLYRRVGNVRDPLALAGWILRMVTRLCMLPVLGGGEEGPVRCDQRPSPTGLRPTSAQAGQKPNTPVSAVKAPLAASTRPGGASPYCTSP